MSQARRREVSLLANDRHATLDAISAASLNAVIAVDHNGKIIAWNSLAETVFGWTRAEALGQSVHDTIIRERDRNAHARVLTRYTAGAQSDIFGRRLERTALRTDGTEIPIELSIMCINSAGEDLLVCFIRDLSEQQRAESAMDELQLRSVHGSGMSAGAKTVRKLTHEFNHPLAAATNERAPSANVTKACYDTEPSRFDDERRALRRQVAESRRQFTKILKSLGGLFYRCEPHSPWRTSFVDKGLEALTGFDAGELRAADGWRHIIDVEDRATVDRAVALAVASECDFQISYRIVRKTGEVRWVETRGYAIYGEGGDPLFLEGVITDISKQKEADELQKNMMERWTRTLDAIPQMVWTTSARGGDEFYNAQWYRFTGGEVGGHSGLRHADLIHPDDRERVVDEWTRNLSSGRPYEAQYRLKHVSGEYRWVLGRGRSEKDPAGTLLGWYGTCTEIHDHVCAHQALETSEALNRSMIDSSPDCIWLLDTTGKTKFLNRAATKTLGLANSHDLLGRPWAAAFPHSFRGPVEKAVSKAALGKTSRFTATKPSPTNQQWWDVMVAPVLSDSGQLDAVVSVARDITHRKTAEERIRWIANHDPLTHLPNRSLFRRTVARALAEAQLRNDAFTVLVLNLDDFKRTNDGLGLDAGDAVLAEFAGRLRQAVKVHDMVARLGGDEFAVLLRGVRDDRDIELAVQSILARLEAPCEFRGKLLDIRTSIGASTYPGPGRTGSELLKHADIALHAAKASGRGTLRIFRPAMRANAQTHLSMLNLAGDAIREGRIVANYQPKVDLRSGKLDGFEALLRWSHPTKGLQSPDTIEAAFQDGVLAAEISDRIIDCVLTDMRHWTEAGIEFGHVAINAAAAEFKSGNFAEKLLTKLQKANLKTSRIQLEVTETVFLGRGAEHVESTLRILSREGIKIALDDFGTGFASLSHLIKFPVDIIKIDRSFIGKLETSEPDAAIVRAVIKLGRSLGIKIVAEGIETERQAEFLKRHRCHSGQGYFYGKALPAAELSGLAVTWRGFAT